MPERPIIARAQAAGTRRLRVVARRTSTPSRAGAAPAPRTRNLAGLNQFLERAREQGAAMVSVAREQAEAIAQGAREQGFEVGYNEGIARAEAAVVERLATGRAARRARCARRARRRSPSCERDLVELAFQIAEKVVRQRVAADPDATVGVLEHALRKAFVARRADRALQPRRPRAPVGRERAPADARRQPDRPQR